MQATKPPIERGGEGVEKEGDLNAPSTTTEGEENGTTFAFTMAPDAVRYNGKEGEEDIAHATPIKPADPEQEHRIEEEEEEEEEEGVAAFTSPPPPQFSFDDGYNVRRSAEEESTPPVKINLQSFEENEEEEDGDINRKKKVSSLDESFDPEEYITRFVTPEKKTAPLAKQKKATIDVPMDELEAIFRPTKNKGDYDDDYVPHSFSRFLEKEKNKTDEGANLHAHEKQRLSSFEREILESKRRKEQMGGESSISDMVNRNATLPIFGGSNAAGISRLEQDEIMSLQNMIDDLTTEKLSLKRGMDKNQKIIESLMEENESLTNAFNEAKNTNAVLENQLKKLSSEMMLHSSVQQSISNDRDASRRGYIETRERANELAREVIELEEVVLEYKSKLFLYENTQTDALERSKELERALRVANEDREYYQNFAEAMNEERREMQRRVGESNAMQALIASGDVPIVEMLQNWLKQVKAKPLSQEQNVPSSSPSRSAAPEQHESLETSTSEADFVRETRTSEAVATTKELIEALTRLASTGVSGSNSNNGSDECAPSSDADDDNEEENGEEDGVVVDEAQIQLITSIHELLIEIENETATFRVKLKDAERREMGLRAANAALESRLARFANASQVTPSTNTDTEESEGRDDVIDAMRRINAGSVEPTPRPRESGGGFRFRTGLVPDDD